MKSYEEMLEIVEMDIEMDWMPLVAIVNEFIESDRLEPTQEEFLQALDFIAKILDKEDVVCLEGPEMEKVEGTGPEIANWILDLYNKEGYESINFGIWFDQKSHYS